MEIISLCLVSVWARMEMDCLYLGSLPSRSINRISRFGLGFDTQKQFLGSAPGTQNNSRPRHTKYFEIPQKSVFGVFFGYPNTDFWGRYTGNPFIGPKAHKIICSVFLKHILAFFRPPNTVFPGAPHWAVPLAPTMWPLWTDLSGMFLQGCIHGKFSLG